LRAIVPVEWHKKVFAGSLFADARHGQTGGIAEIMPRHPAYIYPAKVCRGWHGYCFRESIRYEFKKAVRDFQPNAVLAAYAYPDGWAAVNLSHQVGLPAIIKVHGSDVLRMGRRGGKMLRTIDALRKADGVVAVSRDLAARVTDLRASADRVTVIYDGIDSDVFYPGSQMAARDRLGLTMDKKIILFVGRIVPVKGLDVLVSACSCLMRSNVDFMCYIVGEGRSRKHVTRHVSRLGLNNRIRLVGAVAHRNLADWYRAADVLVLPSYSEGVPCVLYEAAACKTQFIASDVGGVSEVAHLVTSTLVPPGNAHELADAIYVAITRDKCVNGTGWGRSHSEAASELKAFIQTIAEKC
jgi:glycosyltransferase involved in cell wall biosynthesis